MVLQTQEIVLMDQVSGKLLIIWFIFIFNLHYVDSLTSALREIEFFFPHFNHQEWLEKKEPLIRSGKCNLDLTTFTHKLN